MTESTESSFYGSFFFRGEPLERTRYEGRMPYETLQLLGNLHGAIAWEERNGRFLIIATALDKDNRPVVDASFTLDGSKVSKVKADEPTIFTDVSGDKDHLLELKRKGYDQVLKFSVLAQKEPGLKG